MMVMQTISFFRYICFAIALCISGNGIAMSPGNISSFFSENIGLVVMAGATWVFRYGGNKLDGSVTSFANAVPVFGAIAVTGVAAAIVWNEYTKLRNKEEVNWQHAYKDKELEIGLQKVQTLKDQQSYAAYNDLLKQYNMWCSSKDEWCRQQCEATTPAMTDAFNNLTRKIANQEDKYTQIIQDKQDAHKA